MTSAQVEDLLRIEEADAWFEYLEETRGRPLFAEGHGSYEEVEPWAWARLVGRLKAIAARRKQV